MPPVWKTWGGKRCCELAAIHAGWESFSLAVVFHHCPPPCRRKEPPLLITHNNLGIDAWLISYLIIAGTKLPCKIRVLWPYRPVQQQLIDTGIHQQGGVSGLSTNPGPSRYATDGAAFTHHQALGFGQLPCGGLGVGGRQNNKSAEAHNHYSSKIKTLRLWNKKTKCCRWKYDCRTCCHVKEEGEDAAPVVASPKNPPRSIKGERQHAACQLTRTALHLLASGDVHHLQVVLAVSYLQYTKEKEDF